MADPGGARLQRRRVDGWFHGRRAYGPARTPGCACKAVPVTTIEVVRGDLTQRRVDAIVNAANSSLMGGGGVDGAIHTAGGARILDECIAVRRTSWPDGLPTGEAVATTAGDLPARWVIHTVGPVFAQYEPEEADDLLRGCHISALLVARDLGARSVAFPAISCGAYGFPVERAAPIAVAAVRSLLSDLDTVEFVLFDSAAFDAFESALDRVA